MDKLIEHLSNKWAIFKQAPVEIIVLLILVGVAVWYIADFIYKERIETLKQQIEGLKQQIEGYKHDIGEYRQRLQLDGSDKTAFSQLTNAELKRKTFALIEQMREFLKHHYTLDRQRNAQHYRELDQAQTNEERMQIWQEHQRRNASALPSALEIKEKFKATPLLLRDELRRRLPPDYQSAYRSYYEGLTNYMVVQQIVDDLEKMAESLP